MDLIFDWVNENKEWLFSGVGVVIIGGIWHLIRRQKGDSISQEIHSGDSSTNVQAGRDVEFTAGAKDDGGEKD